MTEAHDQLAEELVQEKKAREDAEKRVKALETEKAGADAKRSRELEMKQFVIANLEAHKSKQAATIAKLKEEIAELRATVQGSKAVAAQQEERIKLLEGDVEAERQAGLAAQAEVLSVQRALESTKMELEDARAARESALADAKSIEARLDFLTSEEGKKEVIEDYRQGLVVRVELSLAIKVGFDFLRARLPPPALGSATVPYPSHVQSCVDILEDLEARGGGV